MSNDDAYDTLVYDLCMVMLLKKQKLINNTGLVFLFVFKVYDELLQAYGLNLPYYFNHVHE